jgi:2-dehydro-3-deoxygluconokinase
MRIVLIGEAMLELSRARVRFGGGGAGSDWRIGYGGDTLNTAIHLARAGCDVAYFTALGSDTLSANLRPQWEAEGLDCSLILTDPARSTGLYAISTDAQGERSFSYWRSDSAARQMFELPECAAMFEHLERTDILAYSLITLAILPPEARNDLFALCAEVRARGGKVAFDGNYRPRLWNSQAEAREARDAALACADIGLPTLEDEAMLSGETSAAAVAAHWQALGCAEVCPMAPSCRRHKNLHPLIPAAQVMPSTAAISRRA